MEKRFDKRVAPRRVMIREERAFDLDDAENVPRKSFTVYNGDKTSTSDYKIKDMRKLDFSEYSIFFFTVKNQIEKVLKWGFLLDNSYEFYNENTDIL